MAPPTLPECASFAAVRRLNCSAQMPRQPMFSAGCFPAAPPPSADSIASAASNARFASISAGSEGLPTSSSPSRNSFTLTGQPPSTARKPATASTATVVEPFTSEAPRA